MSPRHLVVGYVSFTHQGKLQTLIMQQKFYDADLLKDYDEQERQRQTAPASRSNPDLEEARQKDELSAPLAASPRKQPFYKTRKGIIIIVVALLLVIGAIVGGAVGGTRKKGNGNDNNSQSTGQAPIASDTPPPSGSAGVATTEGSGGGGAQVGTAIVITDSPEATATVEGAPIAGESG